MGNDKKTFYLKSGKTFSTLKGLSRELMSMSYDVYEHHVNEVKNDFANWVGDSLNKKDLSKKVEGQITKIELELELLRHLVHEEGKKITTKKAVTKKVPVVTKVTKKIASKKSNSKK